MTLALEVAGIVVGIVGFAWMVLEVWRSIIK